MMTAGSPMRRWPCRMGEGQRSLACRPRAEPVLEARRALRGERGHRKAEVGIVSGEPSFWSQGYGTEAMRVVLRYGFDVLALNKISLDVLEYNTRALRTYERLGFQREGVHREDIYKDGRFVNV